MESSEQATRQIQSSIRRLLLYVWDPIGVAANPQAQGRYDAYVAGVYHLLENGAGPQEVADHLARLERDAIGVPVSSERAAAVARMLCALDLRMH
jgi:hypothetical protein